MMYCQHAAEPSVKASSFEVRYLSWSCFKEVSVNSTFQQHTVDMQLSLAGRTPHLRSGMHPDKVWPKTVSFSLETMTKDIVSGKGVICKVIKGRGTYARLFSEYKSTIFSANHGIDHETHCPKPSEQIIMTYIRHSVHQSDHTLSSSPS